MPYDRYVREEIFGPLGMDDCWVGLPADRYEAYGDRIGFMHTTSGDTRSASAAWTPPTRSRSRCPAQTDADP